MTAFFLALACFCRLTGVFVVIFLFVFLGAFVTLDAYRYMW